jgi:hypothetical protein
MIDEPKKGQRLPSKDLELEAYKSSLGVEDLTLLKSSAVVERYRLEENLLVEHCSRQGDFWRAIEGLRERWNISPTIGIPPEESGLNSPLPKSEEIPEKEMKKLRSRWIEDLSSISQRFFPKRPGVMSGGNRFVTSCAFYDPPRDNLFGFLQAAATSPGLQLPIGWKTRKDEPLIAISGLPVKKLPDSGRVAGAWRSYYGGIIRELGERHLKPRGLDVKELVEDVLRHNPALSKNLDARLQLANEEASEYIKVDDDMTRDDILGAAQFITQSSGPHKGGRPPRNRLVAVQHAILKDEYGWSYKQIAEQFGQPTDDTSLRRLEAHVKFGRQIVEKR